MSKRTRIAVAQDRSGWHDRFVDALRQRRDAGLPFDYASVNLDADDWIDSVTPFDAVLWKPHYMGTATAWHFKEKVYFMESFLGKVVVPSFKTIWHFESKVAQTWLFRHGNVSTPRTFASFDWKDAQAGLEKTAMPLVFKASQGAGGTNVRLIKERTDARSLIDRILCQQKWEQIKRTASFRMAVLRALPKKWFSAKCWRYLLHREREDVVYWQEFLPDNPADLRITVIGDSTAFAFWRHNRPGDFRASGSGLIDYDRPVPPECIRYCVSISRQFGFDSMAYDLLFKDQGFVINEMSYGYIDKTVFDAPGFYTMKEGASLEFTRGHVWPQEVWVDWVLHRVGIRALPRG